MAVQPLSPATDRRLGGPLPHQPANRTRGHLKADCSFSLCSMPSRGLMRFQQSFPTVVPLFEAGSSRVTHPFATRSRKQASSLSFDLHVLGAPPAFVLSQDQTLYKWYLITYKVLNRCNHSDTIACVLYELLVNLELINVGFQTHDQGSTSFSFVQFSRSCCAVAFP